jgi:urease gamma subunit
VASTTAVLRFLKDSDTFLRWSSVLSNAIRRRDDEDGFKLHHGIAIAINRGTLLELTEEERALADVSYESVDVLGKTPVEVSNFIWERVKLRKLALATNSSDDNNAGELIALCGLSGTGKVM